MPELPDVEGFKRYWARHASGQRVKEVRVPNPAIVRNTSPSAVARALKGRRLERPSRHGKWMFAPAGGPILLLHFGMTGGLVWSRDESGRHHHDRLILVLDGGEIRYRNMRMLGGAWLARDASQLERITGELGPDAATAGRPALEKLLADRRGGIKAALMNQRLIAGIGNELSDEILWQARIHPSAQVQGLGRRRLGALHRAMTEVIAESNRHGHIPRLDGWIASQRGVHDARCPRCRSRLRRTTIAGRTSYWCPRCQRH